MTVNGWIQILLYMAIIFAITDESARYRRTASVTTTSHVRMLVLSADEFKALQDAHPAIAAQIEQTMRERTDQPRDRPAR